jgi:glycosyltransferase involved in cell wall biosynthesis
MSRVAVVMPAYNAERFINRAIASLRRSTYPCDLFVVDDASKVPVSEFVGRLPRTTIIRRAANGGVCAAKNTGLEAILAKGYEFVASLDADDMIHPERIARQVEFMDAHPNVAVVGTGARAFDEETGKTLRYSVPQPDPAAVRRAMHYNSAVNHSSSMIRASALRECGLYSDAYPVAEDYELFRRMLTRYDIANIPAVLMDISISSQGVTLSRRRRQLFDRLRIQLKFFEPTVPASWFGIAKTLVLFAVPVSVVSWLKSYIYRRSEAAIPTNKHIEGSAS